MVCEELVDFLLHLNGQAVAAGENSHEAGEIHVVHFLVAGDSLIEGGNASNVVGLSGLEHLGIALDADLRDKHTTSAPVHQSMNAYAESEAVEHGHCSKHCLSLYGFVTHGARLQSKGVEVQVGEFYSLCNTGCSA